MVSHPPIQRRRELNWFAWIAGFILLGTFGLGGLFGASASSGALDSLVEGCGAAFARGALGQMKADASSVPVPQAR